MFRAHEATESARLSALSAKRCADAAEQLRDDMAKLRQSVAVAQTEARMNGEMSNRWQRLYESEHELALRLQAKIGSGVNIYSGGDTTVGRDIAGNDHGTETG